MKASNETKIWVAIVFVIIVLITIRIIYTKNETKFERKLTNLVQSK